MVLMRTLWSSPEAVQGAELHEDLKARLFSVLRKCRSQGHTELVFGAWGLLGHATEDEVSSISALLHRTLLGSSDVARSFTKVIIAGGHHFDNDQTMQVFSSWFTEK